MTDKTEQTGEGMSDKHASDGHKQDSKNANVALRLVDVKLFANIFATTNVSSDMSVFCFMSDPLPPPPELLF